MATLYFLAWIREEVASFSPLERWLFETTSINCGHHWNRCNEAASDKELAQLFTDATGMHCTAKEVERARANIRRRLKHPAPDETFRRRLKR
jgi:hypothetical protein